MGPLIFIGVLFVYQRVWTAGFISDDSMNITENPYMQSLAGLRQLWTSWAAGFFPLTLTVFWIEHYFWGIASGPYHLLTLSIHAFNALLLMVVLRELGVKGAWLGAALWALHPVQVDSVAYVTEQKNTQSCFFYLLSILFFLKWNSLDGPPDASTALRGHLLLLLSLLGASLSVLSKTSTVMLPLVLCLCRWWLGLRWDRRGILSMAPFFFISLCAGLATILWERVQPLNDGTTTLPLVGRLVLSGRIPWFYVGKLVWPHPLVPVYSHWEVHPAQILCWLPLLGLIAGLLFLWKSRMHVWGRAALFASVYFIISLFPVMGFFPLPFPNADYPYVADHLQYLASMGPLALAGAGIVTVFNDARYTRLLRYGVSSLLLIGLGSLTWSYSHCFLNEESYWRETVRWVPTHSFACNNLGVILLRQGKIEESISYFEKAIRDNSDDPILENNLGWAKRKTGHYEDALVHLNKALESRSSLSSARALVEFQAGVHFNLGDTLLQMGRYDEAIMHFRADMANNPKFDPAEQGIVAALLAKGNEEEAVTHLKHLHQLMPDDPATLHALGKLLYKRGERTQGIALLRAAFRPQYSDLSLLNDFAWMLATAPESYLRNGKLSLELAQKAVRMSGEKVPSILDTLAAAFAENGEYSKALEAGRLALSLTQSAGNTELAENLEKELSLYEQGRPLREPCVP